MNRERKQCNLRVATDFFCFKNIIRHKKHKIYSLTHPSVSSPAVLLSSYCVTITIIHLKNCHFVSRKLFSYCTLILHPSSQARASTLLFSTSINLTVLARAVCRNRQHLPFITGIPSSTKCFVHVVLYVRIPLLFFKKG